MIKVYLGHNKIMIWLQNIMKLLCKINKERQRLKRKKLNKICSNRYYKKIKSKEEYLHCQFSQLVVNVKKEHPQLCLQKANPEKHLVSLQLFSSLRTNNNYKKKIQKTKKKVNQMKTLAVSLTLMWTKITLTKTLK